jgi:hypothetical protein
MKGAFSDLKAGSWALDSANKFGGATFCGNLFWLVRRGGV